MKPEKKTKPPPPTLEELRDDLEKWARLCAKDMKFYKGFIDAIDDLDAFKAKADKASA